MVGKYLTDTTGTDVAGFIPAMVDHVPHNEDGVGGGHVYMPWWLDNKKLDFPRGPTRVWGARRRRTDSWGLQRYPATAEREEAKDDYRI